MLSVIYHGKGIAKALEELREGQTMSGMEELGRMMKVVEYYLDH